MRDSDAGLVLGKHSGRWAGARGRRACLSVPAVRHTLGRHNRGWCEARGNAEAGQGGEVASSCMTTAQSAVELQP